MRVVYLDGKFEQTNQQLIDAFTPGVFKAKGVFETMLGLDGVVLDVSVHLTRLREGLKVLEIKAPSINPLIVKELLDRNLLSSARVRVMVWQAGQQVHVMMAALPYKVPDKKKYRVCLIKTDRPANDKMAQVKSLDYELFSHALHKAQQKGFDEALLLNNRGHIFEASRANIFWLKNKVLYTPPLSSGCLNGITRRQVIKQAKLLHMPVEEKNLTPQALKAAEAAFLTNSLIGITAIDLTEIKIA